MLGYAMSDEDNFLESFCWHRDWKNATFLFASGLKILHQDSFRSTTQRKCSQDWITGSEDSDFGHFATKNRGGVLLNIVIEEMNAIGEYKIF